MNKKYTYLVAILFLFGGILYAQKNLEKGNEKFRNYSFHPAKDIYLKLVAKGKESPEVYRKLGDSYYFTGKFKEAEKWYTKLFEVSENFSAELYFRYAQSLKSSENYEKSNLIMEKIRDKFPQDQRAYLYSLNKDYLSDITVNNDKFKINRLKINTEQTEYGPVFYRNYIVFSSVRDTSGLFRRRHTWDNSGFTDLYFAEVEENELANIQEFSSNINGRFHESTPVFSKDGKTMYFTSNNRSASRSNNSNITRLKIYKAILNDEGEWDHIEELPFNSENYSTAHPALNADETFLYFASDMPGSIGLSDIYKVAIFNDGSFGEPINLGKTVNTESTESFPFISSENQFFYSSNGYPGLGGLDIFTVNSLDTINKVIHLGMPINSEFDDFGFIINAETGKGYFSSNRKGGAGRDDLYHIIQVEELQSCTNRFDLKVLDTISKQAINKATVSIITSENEKQDVGETNTGGELFIEDFCDSKYLIRIAKKDYESKELFLESTDTVKVIYLKPAVTRTTVGDDLATKLELKPIYFELDESNIRQDAKMELEKVIAIMDKYPSMKIEIRAYTDHRASKEYNLELSQRRAETTAAYIVESGINSERVSYKGFGETNLQNDCIEGVDCPESKHELNRRSEFIILE